MQKKINCLVLPAWYKNKSGHFSTEKKDLTYARRLDIRRSFSKIPRLLTTLPNNLKVIERSFPDQENFPKLVEFLKDLTNRGLFEIIYPKMVEYARMKKKETMRYKNFSLKYHEDIEMLRGIWCGGVRETRQPRVTIG